MCRPRWLLIRGVEAIFTQTGSASWGAAWGCNTIAINQQYQSISVSTSQSINQPTDQSTDQSTDLPINQPSNQPKYQPTKVPIKQSTNQPKVPTNISTNQPKYQSANRPTNQSREWCFGGHSELCMNLCHNLQRINPKVSVLSPIVVQALSCSQLYVSSQAWRQRARRGKAPRGQKMRAGAQW